MLKKIIFGSTSKYIWLNSRSKNAHIKNLTKSFPEKKKISFISPNYCFLIWSESLHFPIHWLIVHCKHGIIKKIIIYHQEWDKRTPITHIQTFHLPNNLWAGAQTWLAFQFIWCMLMMSHTLYVSSKTRVNWGARNKW